MKPITNTSHRRTPVALSLVAFCFLAFESISFSSSHQGLMMIFGRGDWAILLAYAFIAVDLGGIAQLLTIRSNESVADERAWAIPLFVAWLISAVGDTYMTYLPISLTASQLGQTHIMVTSGVVSLEFFSRGIPAIMAGLLFLIQVSVVGWFTKAIADYKGGVVVDRKIIRTVEE